MFEELIDILEIPELRFTGVIREREVPIYTISAAKENIFRLEIIFQGNKLLESKNAVSSAFNFHLQEIINKSIELFDSFGIQISLEDHVDSISLSVSGLTRHFQHFFPLFAKVLLDVEFDEVLLDRYIQKKSQQLRIDLHHNEVLAQRILNTHLFGPNHPYGRSIFQKDLAELKLIDLENFYKNQIVKNKMQMIIHGYNPEKLLKTIDQYFISNLSQGSMQKPLIAIKSNIKSVRKENKSSVHWAIKMGILAKINHVRSSASWTLMNNVVGGYYGSRLAKKIREHKGITYDISSTLERLRFAAIFAIHTEVSPKNEKAVRKMIQEELTLLKKEPISKLENRMVKNYVFGRYLRFFDDNLGQVNLLKYHLVHSIAISEEVKKIQAIKEFQPEELMGEFEKNFLMENFCNVIIR